jgi:hypothetical protein
MSEERPLFVHHGGSAVGVTCIARLFKEVTGNSFTSLQTMLHTDLGVAHGTAGTEMAMVAAHQTSHATAQKYAAQIVAITRGASKDGDRSKTRNKKIVAKQAEARRLAAARTDLPPESGPA